MPRGQSKTPTEHAREAIERQAKVVEKLRATKAKYSKAIEEARAGIDELHPVLEYEQGVLDQLKRHPALGQTSTPPEDLGVAEVPSLEVDPSEPLFVYDVETPKVDPRKGVDPTVRAAGIQSTVASEAPADEETRRTLSSSTARQPWSL